MVQYYNILKRYPFEQFVCMKLTTSVNVQHIFNVFNVTQCMKTTLNEKI